MDDLDYEKHLANYKWTFGYASLSEESKPSMLNVIEKQAQMMHSLVVSDALLECYVNTTQIAQELKSTQARYYMLYGAGRRLEMMFDAFREIITTADVERTDPLEQQEQRSLSIDINVIYMHLRGLLDNLAWCLLYERQPSLEADLHRNDVDLFSSKFRKKFSAFTELAAAIIEHDTWNKEVKERRDPVAHRIPLYLPHTAITPEQVTEYRDLISEFQSKIRELQTKEAETAMAQIHRVGQYVPYFLHHPEEPAIPVYPTIPTDMAHAIRIATAVKNALLPKGERTSE